MKKTANKFNIDTHQSVALMLPPFEERHACLSENKSNTPYFCLYSRKRGKVQRTLDD